MGRKRRTHGSRVGRKVVVAASAPAPTSAPTPAPGPAEPPQPPDVQAPVPSGRLPGFLRGAIGLLLFLGISVPFSAATRADGVDYVQFWLIGQEMPFGYYGKFAGEQKYARLGGAAVEEQGGEKIAAAVASRSRFEMTATPLFYTLCGLAVTGDYERDLRLFQFANLLAFLAGTYGLMRLWGYPRSWALLVLALVGLFYWPLRWDISTSNTNGLLLGGVAAYAWLARRRSRWAVVGSGAWLAFLTAVKPMTLLALPILLVLRCASRSWRRLASEAIGAAAGLLIAFLSPLAIGAPLRLWRDFFQEQYRYVAQGLYGHRGLGNTSCVRALSKALGLSQFELWALLGGLLAAGIAALLFAYRSRSRSQDEDLFDGDLALALGLALFLALSPLAWSHYFLLSLPLGLLLLRPDLRASRWRAWIACFALCMLAIHPISQFREALLETFDVSWSVLLGIQLQGGNAVLLTLGALLFVARLTGRGQVVRA